MRVAEQEPPGRIRVPMAGFALVEVPLMIAPVVALGASESSIPQLARSDTAMPRPTLAAIFNLFENLLMSLVLFGV